MNDIPLYSPGSEVQDLRRIIRNAAEMAETCERCVKVDLNGTGYADLFIPTNAVKDGEIQWHIVGRIDKSDKVLVDVRDEIFKDLEKSLIRGQSVTLGESITVDQH